MEIKMELLLLEDDEKICEEFEDIISKTNNIKLKAKTNSSIEALKIIQKYNIDVAIVDLELHYGIGSGLEFLKELKMMKFKNKPIIIVNTNIVSDIIYDNIHKGMADMIFYKKQKDYSAKMVIDTLLLIQKEKNGSNELLEETLLDRNERISNLINLELDLVGINYKLKGRTYIHEAIFYMIEGNEESSVFQYLANKHKLIISSIGKAIQTAINEAWRNTCIEDLKEHYTAKINYNTGVPTPTEFLYYYRDKIKKRI